MFEKNSDKVTIDNSERFQQYFSSMPEQYRIEATIHDGQWITVPKWALFAKVEEKEIAEFISNCTYLIEEDDSYRVDADEIERWHNENNITIGTPIVPNMFTPRIWGGVTEVDAFRLAPKEPTQSIIATSDDFNVLKRVSEIIAGRGIISRIENYRYYIYCASAQYIVDKIQKDLTPEEFSRLNLRVRKAFYWREIISLPEGYLRYAVDFYCTLAKAFLKNRRSTLEFYYSTPEDIDAQIYDWVNSSYRKSI